jgi:hypothetical protein
MILMRLLVVLICGYLMTGCLGYFFGETKSLKRDINKLKAIIRETPVPSLCSPPGMPQPRACNYSLVVEQVQGNIYRGYVNPEVVKAGEVACKQYEQQFQEDDYTEFRCPRAEDYRYNWWEFELEGDAKPTTDGKAQDFTNVVNKGSLRLGKLVHKIEPVGTPIGDEFKGIDPRMATSKGDKNK